MVPGLSLGVKYNIFKVVLSARGYLVVQARTAFSTYEEDMLIVYSINGEKVAEQKLDEFVNAMLFDPTEYYLVSPSARTRGIDHRGKQTGSEAVLHHHTERGEPEQTERDRALPGNSGVSGLHVRWYFWGSFIIEGSTMLVGLANSQLATLELRRNADE